MQLTQTLIFLICIQEVLGWNFGCAASCFWMRFNKVFSDSSHMPWYYLRVGIQSFLSKSFTDHCLLSIHHAALISCSTDSIKYVPCLQHSYSWAWYNCYDPRDCLVRLNECCVWSLCFCCHCCTTMCCSVLYFGVWFMFTSYCAINDFVRCAQHGK